MNLLRHPDLLDQLAASHALGTLRAGARRRFEQMARDNPGVRARALYWQETLAALTELQPAHVPGPNVWKRIENQLPSRLPAANAPAPRAAAGPADDLLARLRRSLGLWRGAAFAGALATVVAVVVGIRLDGEADRRGAALALASQNLAQATREKQTLSAQLQTTPQIEYVAVLSNDQAAPAVLVTFDPVRRSLTLKRVGSGFQETADQSLELWALPPGGSPQSLGVMGTNAPLSRLTAAEAQVAPVPQLAISLEPKGGAPAGGGPTGPILFKGALLKTTL